ncbi:hypothetical protein [Dictyobacter kobayashii]|uniref:Uncharacterized protein n=1 Tax=Dictyobacter kobayashii TaxID=2014872 RepID=A0A402AI01_9CHLR|nr:hypothetical protein [Dictyobacter kobayashii]GCE18664.1 hypothetical protein KDK_24640 [Dictyobacter kobayashii]
MSSAQSEDTELFAKAARMLQADGLPGVLISNRPWRELAIEAVTHLQTTKVPIYVRHGQLVRIQRKEDGTPFIDALTDATLKGILGRSMNFVKLMARGPVHVAPPDNVVKDILTMGEWLFPPLDSIIEFPIFRPDGTLIEIPGYDAVTRSVYVPLPSLKIPPIPEQPTDEDIMNAQVLLDEAIGEFPYENEASHANAIGLMLTPLIRQSINGHVPLALIDATRPGTGKSLLAETVAFIATGRKAEMMTAPYDDDEWRKRIASTLSEGATIIIIDNIKAKIQAASLDTALTSSTVKERILGQSKNGVYAQRATWMATGNNIQIGGDLPRRSYWIRMDARTDKPWTRGGFKHNLHEWVPEHRGQLIAALLTLARAWFAAGCPKATVPQMGSFQQWADTIGGILSHCWIEGFLSNLNELYEQGDDDAQQWAVFLRVWHDFYQNTPVLVSTLAKDIKTGSFDDGDTGLGVAGLYNALPDEVSDTKKGDFKRKLGKALSARIGTQFDESGLHLIKAGSDKRSGAVFWSVAGLQVSQDAIPQKEEISYIPTPLEGLGGGLSGDIPLENKLDPEENKPAKPANLQDVQGLAVDEVGHPLQHFQIVMTPQGEGFITVNLPRCVNVLLYLSQEEVSFRTEGEIAQIQPLHQAAGPDEWPYTIASLTDEHILRLGYPSRAALGYPPPSPPLDDLQ